MKVLDLDSLELKRGSHSCVEEGVCFMEAVAWRKGEPHSDRPKCASSVLGQFGRMLNDRMDDECRQKLIPFIDSVGETGSDALDRARYEYLLNATLNVLIPIALRNLADRIAPKDFGLAEKFRQHARQFEELPKIKYALALALALALAPPDQNKVWEAAIEIFEKAIDLKAEEVAE